MPKNFYSCKKFKFQIGCKIKNHTIIKKFWTQPTGGGPICNKNSLLLFELGPRRGPAAKCHLTRPLVGRVDVGPDQPAHWLGGL